MTVAKPIPPLKPVGRPLPGNIAPANRILRSPRLPVNRPAPFRPPSSLPRAGVPAGLPLPLQLRNFQNLEKSQQQQSRELNQLLRDRRSLTPVLPSITEQANELLDLEGPNFSDAPINDPSSSNALRPTPQIEAPVPLPDSNPNQVNMPGYGVQAEIFSVNNNRTINYQNLISYEVLGPTFGQPGVIDFRATFSPFGDPCQTPVVGTVTAIASTFRILAAGPFEQGSLSCSGPEPDYNDLPRYPVNDIPPDLFNPARESPPGLPKKDIPPLFPDFEPFFPIKPVPTLPPVGPTPDELEPLRPPIPAIPDIPASPEGEPAPAPIARRSPDPNQSPDSPTGRDGRRGPRHTPVDRNQPDPERQKRRRRPPPDFDLCSDECFSESTQSAIALVKVRQGNPLYFETLVLSTPSLGVDSGSLPDKIARIALEAYELPSNLNEFGQHGDNELIGQFGTAVLKVDGWPMATYSLNRFQKTYIEVPYSEDGTVSVMVVPAVPCKVDVVDFGDRWLWVNVTNTASLPTIDSSVLL